jgi:hypothetical protein
MWHATPLLRGASPRVLPRCSQPELFSAVPVRGGTGLPSTAFAMAFREAGPSFDRARFEHETCPESVVGKPFAEPCGNRRKSPVALWFGSLFGCLVGRPSGERRWNLHVHPVLLQREGDLPWPCSVALGGRYGEPSRGAHSGDWRSVPPQAARNLTDRDPTDQPFSSSRSLKRTYPPAPRLVPEGCRERVWLRAFPPAQRVDMHGIRPVSSGPHFLSNLVVRVLLREAGAASTRSCLVGSGSPGPSPCRTSR